jgi:hypothetical protein
VADGSVGEDGRGWESRTWRGDRQSMIPHILRDNIAAADDEPACGAHAFVPARRSPGLHVPIGNMALIEPTIDQALALRRRSKPMNTRGTGSPVSSMTRLAGSGTAETVVWPPKVSVEPTGLPAMLMTWWSESE